MILYLKWGKILFLNNVKFHFSDNWKGFSEKDKRAKIIIILSHQK